MLGGLESWAASRLKSFKPLNAFASYLDGISRHDSLVFAGGNQKATAPEPLGVEPFVYPK